MRSVGAPRSPAVAPPRRRRVDPDLVAAAIVGMAAAGCAILAGWLAVLGWSEPATVPYPGLASFLAAAAGATAAMTSALAIGIARHGRAARRIGLAGAAIVSISGLLRLGMSIQDPGGGDSLLGWSVLFYVALAGAAGAAALLLLSSLQSGDRPVH